MVTATLLTLLVVPVASTLFDDLREVVSAVLRRALGGRPRPEVAPEATA